MGTTLIRLLHTIVQSPISTVAINTVVFQSLSRSRETNRAVESESLPKTGKPLLPPQEVGVLGPRKAGGCAIVNIFLTGVSLRGCLRGDLPFSFNILEKAEMGDHSPWDSSVSEDLGTLGFALEGVLKSQ